VVEENILVLEALSFDAPKTKEFANVLKGLSINAKTLVVTDGLDENVALSARNIPGVTVVTASEISVLDVLGHDKLVMTKSAVEKVEEVLA
jgi:large subunit ribosomal protein L4